MESKTLKHTEKAMKEWLQFLGSSYHKPMVQGSHLSH